METTKNSDGIYTKGNGKEFKHFTVLKSQLSLKEDSNGENKGQKSCKTYRKQIAQ